MKSRIITLVILLPLVITITCGLSAEKKAVLIKDTTVGIEMTIQSDGNNVILCNELELEKSHAYALIVTGTISANFPADIGSECDGGKKATKSYSCELAITGPIPTGTAISSRSLSLYT